VGGWEEEEEEERERACVCVCVCEMNLAGEEEGIVPNWSVVVSPRSGLEKCGHNLQFRGYTCICLSVSKERLFINVDF